MKPGTVDLTGIKYVPEHVFPAIKRYRIFKEDIFISVAGTLGIVGKVPKQLDGANLTENADRITDITCDQDYLLHVLTSPVIQNTISAIQTVGAQPKLALTRIRKFTVPLPPTKLEQQAIAEALSDADALIEGLEALIATKRQLKQGATQKLLKPSNNWLEKRLGEICNPSKERFNPMQSTSDRKCVELEHISSDTGSLLGFTSTSGLKSQKAIFKKGDVLFGKLRPYLKKYWFAEFNGVCSTEIWVLQAGSSIFSGWLYWLMQTDSVIDAANKSTGTKMPRAEWSTMKQTTVFVPPTLKEQTRIATILSDMDAEIVALEGKLAKTRKVKAGMMQDLLTGRVRLV